MWSSLQETAELVTFTEKILNGKLYFLCSVTKRFLSISLSVSLSVHGYLLLDSVQNLSTIWKYPFHTNLYQRKLIYLSLCLIEDPLYFVTKSGLESLICLPSCVIKWPIWYKDLILEINFWSSWIWITAFISLATTSTF